MGLKAARLTCNYKTITGEFCKRVGDKFPMLMCLTCVWAELEVILPRGQLWRRVELKVKEEA